MDPHDTSESEPTKKRVRKSRFDDAAPVVVSDMNVVVPTTTTIQSNEAALLAAAELSKKIMNDKVIQENAMKTATMQSHLASQIASISTILKTVQQQQPKEKKPQYHALRLDSLGREIDEHGNLVKQEVTQIKTLALNNSVVTAKRKKENPYLAHRAPPPVPASVPGLQSVLPSSVTVSSSNVTGTSTTISSTGELSHSQSGFVAVSSTISDTMPSSSAVAVKVEDEEVIDDRITATNRDRRRKKALRFVEPGKYVQIAEDFQRKEERKIIAGYSSGRKSLQNIGAGKDPAKGGEGGAEAGAVSDNDSSDGESEEDDNDIPPPIDGGVVPTLEWWDEVFLPKSVRDNRKISRAAAEVDDYAQLQLQYGKSYKYVQHPIAVKALGRYI